MVLSFVLALPVTKYQVMEGKNKPVGNSFVTSSRDTSNESSDGEEFELHFEDVCRKVVRGGWINVNAAAGEGNECKNSIESIEVSVCCSECGEEGREERRGREGVCVVDGRVFIKEEVCRKWEGYTFFSFFTLRPLADWLPYSLDFLSLLIFNFSFRAPPFFFLFPSTFLFIESLFI